MKKAEIGLAVMGENQVISMEPKGFHGAVCSRSAGKASPFTASQAEGKPITGREVSASTSTCNA